MDTGGIVMTGLDPANVVEAVRLAMSQFTEGPKEIPADYLIDNCSQRAVNFIVSTAKRHAQWSGLRLPSEG